MQEGERGKRSPFPTTEVIMTFTENSKVKDVLANQKAVELMETHFPGALGHPMIGLFKNRTLKSIASMPQLNIDQATFDKLLAELNARVDEG